MEEKLLSRGKTVEDAVASALDKLHAERTDVEVEVLEQPKNGFLGLRSKSALVSVVLIDPTSFKSSLDLEDLKVDIEEKLEVNNSTLDTSLSESGLEGKAWVLDGVLHCKDAQDIYPVVAPANGLKLFKNDEHVTSSVVITEEDIVRVEVINEEVNPTWNLIVSKNKLKATLQIKEGVSTTRVLKNSKPSTFVQLDLEETKSLVPLPLSTVVSSLEDYSITYGIDFDLLAEVCSSGKSGSFVIATGQPPIEGKHGFFKPFDNIDIKHHVKERLDGSVDYREIKEFPSAHHGQILGEVVPPTNGEVGMTITGEPIPPKTVYPVVIKLGSGVTIVEDTKVVSVISGHPSVDIRGQSVHISIVPKLTISSDVTMKTGNIHYIGMVDVRGSVQDSMAIEAQGDVCIGSNVNKSKVISKKSVIVRGNIISSTVTAGRNFWVKEALSVKLSKISSILRDMESAIKQLSEVSAFKITSLRVTGFGPLIKILCDGKFKHLLPLVIDFSSSVKSNKASLESEWFELSERLYRNFVTPNLSSIKTEDDILQLSNVVSSLASFDNEVSDNVEFIMATSVQNSELYSVGDITVSDQGVYNSNLRAKQDIFIKGVLKGGEIQSGRNICIDAIGDRIGYGVLLTTHKDGCIKISQASEDVKIQIGSEFEILHSRCKNVTARLDPDGFMLLTKEDY